MNWEEYVAAPIPHARAICDDATHAPGGALLPLEHLQQDYTCPLRRSGQSGRLKFIEDCAPHQSHGVLSDPYSRSNRYYRVTTPQQREVRESSHLSSSIAERSDMVCGLCRDAATKQRGSYLSSKQRTKSDAY